MVVFTGVFVKAVQLWTCSIYKLCEINKIVCWSIWWSFFSCAVVVQGLLVKVRLWCGLFYIKPLCISPWTLSFNLEKFWNFWHGTISFGISTNLKINYCEISERWTIQRKIPEIWRRKSNGTEISKTFGIAHKVLLFSGNSRESCSIHHWKFLKIQTKIFHQMDSIPDLAVWFQPEHFTPMNLIKK